jgi:hypothetical protein
LLSKKFSTFHIQKRYPSWEGALAGNGALVSGKQPEENKAQTMIKQLGQFAFMGNTLI